MLVNNQNLIQNMDKSSSSNEKITISKDTLDKALELNRENSNQVAVIFDNKVMAIDDTNFTDLKNQFKDDFVQYRGVLIAKNGAKEYLEKIESFVLKDLNVGSADKNSDGNLSVAESIYAKNIVDFEQSRISSLSEVAPSDELERLKGNNSHFISINEIININMQIDTNKNGKVSMEELKSDFNKFEKEDVSLSGGAGDSESILEKLYKKLKELQKQIAKITAKMESSSEEEAQMYQGQLVALNSQVAGINAQIMKILQKDLE